MSLALVGCNSGPKSKLPIQAEFESEDSAPKKPLDLTASSGEFTYSAENDKYWKVRWASADISLDSEKNEFGGLMHATAGSIYEGTEEVSQFRSDSAKVERGSKQLTLMGSVEVKSLTTKLVMKCDRVEYDPERKLVTASGMVRVVGNAYSMGPFSKLYCSPELRRVSSSQKAVEAPIGR